MKKLLLFTAFLGVFSLTACGNDANNGYEEITTGPAELDYDDDYSYSLGYAGENGEAAYDYDVDVDFERFSQFKTIQIGTSIEAAEDLLGAPTSTMSMDLGGHESVTNTWVTTNLFRLSTTEVVTFTDGYATSVMSTADASSNISREQFDQISNGMSEREVYDILGAPYSVTTMEILGSVTTTVMWINADFTSASITFSPDGVVTMTYQHNLN